MHALHSSCGAPGTDLNRTLNGQPGQALDSVCLTETYENLAFVPTGGGLGAAARRPSIEVHTGGGVVFAVPSDLSAQDYLEVEGAGDAAGTNAPLRIEMIAPLEINGAGRGGGTAGNSRHRLPVGRAGMAVVLRSAA